MESPVPRLPDVLFAAFVLVLIVLAALDLRIAALAISGAFVCGATYLFAGMLPARTEPLLQRLFTSVFLAIVLSCLVVILPGTVGASRPELQGIQGVIVVTAALLPCAAIGFEIARTPRVLEVLLRSLGAVLRSLRSR
jgi:predicted neutral ceramidase superfamily lipid hydrolase